MSRTDPSMPAVPCRPPRSRAAGRQPPRAGSASSGAWTPCRRRQTPAHAHEHERGVVSRAELRTVGVDRRHSDRRVQGDRRAPRCDFERRLQRTSGGRVAWPMHTLIERAGAEIGYARDQTVHQASTAQFVLYLRDSIAGQRFCCQAAVPHRPGMDRMASDLPRSQREL